MFDMVLYVLFWICYIMVHLIRLLSRLLIRSFTMSPHLIPRLSAACMCDWCTDQPDQPDQPDQGDHDLARAVCRYVATHRLHVSPTFWAYMGMYVCDQPDQPDPCDHLIMWQFLVDLPSPE